MSESEPNGELLDMCEEFLSRYYRDDIGRLAQRYPNEQRALTIDWSDLLQYNADLADDCLEHPETMKSHLSAALRRFSLPVDISMEDAEVRVCNLNDNRTFDVGGYLPKMIGQALAVRGQVSQVSASKPELVKGRFICGNCGVPVEVPQATDSDEIQQPTQCPGCERQGPFNLDVSGSTLLDSQVVRVQQPPEMSRGSGSHLDIKLKDDLASADIYGGERIRATGTLSIDTLDLEESTFDYHLSGEDVKIEDGSYEDIEPDDYREEIEAIAASDDPVGRLVDNFAPHLSRDSKLDRIIEALILQMVGTARKNPSGGPTKRGDSHMLLLGDPGTSKSELLEEVELLSPRAKLKSGEGVTKSGVTAAATKDDFGATQWSVKAGLLVLASGGIACLDEMDKADETALESMHQALENQRVTVSKAGIDAEMPAKTALLAAGNPIDGRFDKFEPIADQIDLSAPLMSRFDLMFMVHDDVDLDRDAEIADKVITSWSEAGLASHSDEQVEMSAGRDLCDDPERAVEAFRAYLAEAKQKVDPVIRDEQVRKMVKQEYLEIRGEGASEDSPVPITARKLEAFLRLAESSARARLDAEVKPVDVDRASRLVHQSLKDVGYDPETGELDVDIVETGKSRSQRKRVTMITDIIADLAANDRDGASLTDIMKRVTEAGMETDKAEKEIERLLEKGELYECQQDHYRVTS